MIVERPFNLSPELEARFLRVREQLAPLAIELPPMLARTVAQVGIASDFVLTVLKRYPEQLIERIQDEAPLGRAALDARLAPTSMDEREAMAALRRLRQIEMARIAWRDLAGWLDLDTTLAELSMLADTLINAALDYAAGGLEPRFGRPRNAAGAPLPLLVLGMGKLGGSELNFSSDVDLVFLHPEAVASGLIGEAPEAYYRRLAQRLIKLLDEVTDDGFVFRVDTRLRPFGASGPLVVSLPAFESYLVRHGRDWERYAYVKARLITGTEHESELFDEILTPFVYRRYLDFGVFDALRHMKRLISAEVARKDMAENIKLGPGGIREIEFIVQAFQLVRGGRTPALRERSLLAALPLLASDRQLSGATVADLERAYRFLRTLENRLQAMEDRQLHVLPSDAEDQARLAAALGEASWQQLFARLKRHRAAVQAEFERIAWDVHALEPADGRVEAAKAAWEVGRVEEALQGTGLEHDKEAVRLLTELRRGRLYQRMDEPSRQRLAAAVARTIPLVAVKESPAVTLYRVLRVFQAVCRRSAYLALLNENPGALERLLSLVEQSASLARQIAEHPLLLDELLDPRILDTPPTREVLADLLEQQLRNADPRDVESQLEAVRVFHRTAILRIAIADRFGSLPLMKVSDRLTDTAELVLEFALETAWHELTDRYGTPMFGEPPEQAGFAVIGYGKLGGLELGYGSDLDLVFLHDSTGPFQETTGTPPLDNERFFARLVQRLIHFLTIQTSSGRLYEVDTRLRPSGRSGLMVSSIANFGRYQRHEAWTWEHQALLRSRALAGSPNVRAAFSRERVDVLVHHVDRERLRADIASMRQRMRQELSQSRGRGFDIKQDPGGLADVEFLVDYWVLAYAGRFPELVEFPDNVRQLEALERVGVVDAERCRALKDAYLTLRQRIHALALDERGRVVVDDELSELRAWVTALWEEVFGADAG